MKSIHLGAVTSILALAATTALAAPCQPLTNFGAVGTSVGNVLTCTTGGSTTATITGSGSGFDVRAEGDGWAGQFATGDAVLYDTTAGSVTVDFSAPMTTLNNVAIESNTYGAYTATADLYLDGTLVGTDSYSSVSANTPGSIPSFSADIPGGFNEIVFSTTNDSGDFVGLGFGFTSVPEPAAWTLMLIGIGGLGGVMRSRRRMAVATV